MQWNASLCFVENLEVNEREILSEILKLVKEKTTQPHVDEIRDTIWKRNLDTPDKYQSSICQQDLYLHSEQENPKVHASRERTLKTIHKNCGSHVRTSRSVTAQQKKLIVYCGFQGKPKLKTVKMRTDKILEYCVKVEEQGRKRKQSS